MNNTFDLNRFGKVLRRDGSIYIRNFGLTLAILCGIPIVGWLLTLIFGFTMPTLPRWITIYFLVILSVILVPAKAFGDINLPREGVRYAILPVSNMEKFFSYALYCLLTPVVILLAAWGIDSLLTLLPFGGFTHYIKSLGFGNIMKDFIVEISEMTGDDLTDAEGFDVLMKMFTSGYTYSFIVGIIFNVGFFMFGNLLFKTHKTAKSLGCMIGISYVLSMILQLFLITIGKSVITNPEMFNDINTISEFTTNTVWFNNIFHTILAIGIFIGVFFKLKTQKY
jgi:hypothetical protein